MKITRTKEKYKPTTISFLGWCTKRNFFILQKLEENAKG